MKTILLRFCLISFIMAALATAAHADFFYKTKIVGKITHVSLTQDTQRLGQFSIDVAFSAYKCRAVLKNEEIPCKITHFQSVDQEGILRWSNFKIVLNLPLMVKKSCYKDQRCEALYNAIRSCHPNYYEVFYRRVRVLGLNENSRVNILQIDTPSKEEAYHIISKVRWPQQK